MDFKYYKQISKIILLILFGAVFLSSPHPTYAQGTCDCNCPYGVCSGLGCWVMDDKCDSTNGYVARGCDTVDEGGGNYSCTPCECLLESEPTPTPPGMCTCCDTNLAPDCVDYDPLDYSCGINYWCCQTCLPGHEVTPTPIVFPTDTPEITPFQPQMCPPDPDCNPRDEDCTPPLSTAFGCIETSPFKFVKQFRDILIGIGSGIALLMMIIGSFFVLTSQGQPEKVARGKEIFVGGAIGLLIMIFSMFLLRIISVDILGLLRT